MEITHEKAIGTLGFSDKEAKVYLALLELGVGSAIGVSRKAGIKRPTTYVILDELIQKGAVFMIPRSKKKLYRAIPPQTLFENYEERFERAKEVLPKIQAISKQESYKPQVLYYQGVEGVKEAVRYGREKMKGKTFVGFFATAPKDVQKKFDYFKAENDFLRKNGTKTRGIVPKSANLQEYREEDKKYGREMKAVSQTKYSSTVSIEIGENFVRFADYENLQALIIDNPNITKTLGEIFEMVWEKTD